MPPTRQTKSSETNGWGEWANHVLSELKRLNEVADDFRRDLTSVTVEVVQLKVKSSLWGALSGAITVLLLLGVTFLKGTISNEKQTFPIYPQVQPYNKVVEPREYYVIPKKEKEEKEEEKEHTD
jgi:hypothetical protein